MTALPIDPEQHEVLASRAGDALARVVALEELHRGLCELLMERARRAEERSGDWLRVEALVAAVPGSPTSGMLGAAPRRGP